MSDNITDIQSRKWQITINNPEIKGYTHDVIKEIMSKSKNILYWCMADEIGGKEKTYHTHIYLHFSSAVRFSTIKRKFDGGHFEIAKGSAQQNADYVFKTGKWAGTDKEETNLEETRFSSGEIPIERQGHRSDLDDLYDMVKSGMSNYDIISDNPSYILQIDKIDKIRQTIVSENYKSVWRFLDVTYIYGPTGIGKSKGVIDIHGYENVYRVCDYLHPFDDYEGQNIIIFEEFRGQIAIDKMLMYLDGHPCKLPCRYANKVACYTQVYIITNISLHSQYKECQRHEYETYKAFLRRINRVWEYTKEGIIEKNVDYEEWQACKTTPFRIAK